MRVTLMKMITILVSKIRSFVGKLIGKGTSLPGKVALKLCPTILSQLQLPTMRQVSPGFLIFKFSPEILSSSCKQDFSKGHI